MGLVQIVLVWGVASAALFPSPSEAGEWEEYEALKKAVVRSHAKTDWPLPKWAAALEYERPAHWQWGAKSGNSKKAPDVAKTPVSDPVPAAAVSE